MCFTDIKCFIIFYSTLSDALANETNYMLFNYNLGVDKVKLLVMWYISPRFTNWYNDPDIIWLFTDEMTFTNLFSSV